MSAVKYCTVVKDNLLGIGIIEERISSKRIRVKMIKGYRIDSGKMKSFSRYEQELNSIEERFHQNILEDLGGYDYSEEYTEEIERRESALSTLKERVGKQVDDDYYCFVSKDEFIEIPDNIDFDKSDHHLPRLIWNANLSIDEKKEMMFGDGALLFDPKEYDEAIIAYIDGITYYDYNGIVDATYKLDHSCDPYDHVSYNMLGSVSGGQVNIRVVHELEFEPDPDDDVTIVEIKGTKYEVLN